MRMLAAWTKELKWFLFLVPALLFYSVFAMFPALSSVFYAFTNWDGGTHYDFIGLRNFREMFQDLLIVTAFRNTLLYAVFITVFQNLLGLLLALLLYRRFRGSSTLRMMFFMPAIFSTLLIGYVWNYILEPNFGVVNTLLSTLHLEEWQMPWLSDPNWARTMVIVVTVWQFAGYSMVIYIAGLQGIPSDLYEVGDIDGASTWERFRHITFPLIAPAFTINIVLCTIGSLKAFDAVYALTGGGPGYATETVATTIYRLGFGGTGSRWGYGTAMSIVMFLAILLLTVVQVTMLRRREVEM